jgi:hypothetical protein
MTTKTPKAPADSTSVFFIGEPGLAAMAVCAPVAMTHEQIAAEVNAKSPTGITSRWTVTEHADLDTDDVPVYPVQCPDEASRRHYMVHG